MINDNDIWDWDKPYPSGFLILYSMESFIYKNINYAMRTQDRDKFVSLGPISLALEKAVLS